MRKKKGRNKRKERGLSFCFKTEVGIVTCLAFFFFNLLNFSLLSPSLYRSRSQRTISSILNEAKAASPSSSSIVALEASRDREKAAKVEVEVDVKIRFTTSLVEQANGAVLSFVCFSYLFLQPASAHLQLLILLLRPLARDIRPAVLSSEKEEVPKRDGGAETRGRRRQRQRRRGGGGE